MIFMFISSIISIIGFVVLILLCRNTGKLQYALSYLLGTTSVKVDTKDPDSCSYYFLYVHFIIVILIVASIYSVIKLCIDISTLKVYNTILYFRTKHGLRHDRHTSISLEFSTLSQGVIVHIASLKSLIALLSKDNNMAFPEFSPDTNAALNAQLILTSLIFLRHVDCPDLIATSTRFKLGIYQAYKLCNLMKGYYLICAIVFQKNILIPLSKLYTSCKTNIMQDTPAATLSWPPTPLSTPTPPSRSFRRVFEPIPMTGDINTPVTTQ